MSTCHPQHKNSSKRINNRIYESQQIIPSTFSCKNICNKPKQQKTMITLKPKNQNAINYGIKMISCGNFSRNVQIFEENGEKIMHGNKDINKNKDINMRHRKMINVSLNDKNIPQRIIINNENINHQYIYLKKSRFNSKQLQINQTQNNHIPEKKSQNTQKIAIIPQQNLVLSKNLIKNSKMQGSNNCNISTQAYFSCTSLNSMVLMNHFKTETDNYDNNDQNQQRKYIFEHQGQRLYEISSDYQVNNNRNLQQSYISIQNDKMSNINQLTLRNYNKNRKQKQNSFDYDTISMEYLPIDQNDKNLYFYQQKHKMKQNNKLGPITNFQEVRVVKTQENDSFSDFFDNLEQSDFRDSQISKLIKSPEEREIQYEMFRLLSNSN